jgi:hypothetical protein
MIINLYHASESFNVSISETDFVYFTFHKIDDIRYKQNVNLSLTVDWEKHHYMLNTNYHIVWQNKLTTHLEKTKIIIKTTCRSKCFEA